MLNVGKYTIPMDPLDNKNKPSKHGTIITVACLADHRGGGPSSTSGVRIVIQKFRPARVPWDIHK